MLYLILLGLTFIVQLFTVSWYIMSEGIKGRQKALPYKILCSLLFMADVVLAAAIKDCFTSQYFIFICAEMVLCLLGDILLNIEKGFALPAGMAFFAVAKCCGCAAFSQKLFTDFGVAYFDKADIIAEAAFAVLLAVYVFSGKLKEIGKMKIPVIIYGAVIFAGVIKAVHLGILAQQAGGNMQSFSFLLILGALGFAASDAIILLMFFGGKNTRKNSLRNAYLYYFGQMFIACSVLFSGGAG